MVHVAEGFDVVETSRPSRDAEIGRSGLDSDRADDVEHRELSFGDADDPHVLRQFADRIARRALGIADELRWCGIDGDGEIGCVLFRGRFRLEDFVGWGVGARAGSAAPVLDGGTRDPEVSRGRFVAAAVVGHPSDDFILPWVLDSAGHGKPTGNQHQAGFHATQRPTSLSR